MSYIESTRTAKRRRRVAVGTKTIWLEAEQFDNCGGWRNDSQFLESVGSPYLLAAGVGKPVEDAVTIAKVRKAGVFKLWVRCKDWHPQHSPGKFQVLVNGQSSEVTFGQTESDQWQWIDGGTFGLEAGDVEVRLHDLTGWWGRCDAIALSSDSGFTPENDLDSLLKQRQMYGGISSSAQRIGTYDIVVVGGGLAGSLAAISAAREGAKVALIQDRPVLGGNGSSEIQVPVMGDLTYEPWDPRETGLLEEFSPNGAGHGPWSENLEHAARAESNLDLWLNVRLTAVEMSDSRQIEAVEAVNTLTGDRLRFDGTMFIDCSGDAWVGYLAGAEYRHGQESRAEFNEPVAPEVADGCTQSSSLNAGKFKGYTEPIDFENQPWAYQWKSPEDFETSCSLGAVWNDGFRVSTFNNVTNGKGRAPQNAKAPIYEWYVEFGGKHNTIADAEWIRDELFRINIGLWDYVKNHHPEYSKENKNRELTWLNFVVGKRESRRLLGDYVLNQNDFKDNTVHQDAIAYAGWVMDIHHPCGFFTLGPQAHLEYMGRAGIPFRCLYSRNIDNLMMAGRNISVTHLGLAKTRVMRTCALTGWAAGVGAAIAVRENLSPRLVGTEYIHDLQQMLLKEGGYLPGIINSDRLDLARSAKVSASSFATVRDEKYLVTLANYYWKAKHPLETGLAVQFRAPADKIESVSLFLRSSRAEPVEMKLKLNSSRWAGDLEEQGELVAAKSVLPAHFEGWLEFPLNAKTKKGDWYFLSLPKTDGAFWDLYKYHPPETWRGYETSPGWSCEWGCHKFKLEPGGEPAASQFIAEHGLEIPFLPENAINGISRCIEGAPNSWAPDPEEPLPQWLELSFDQPTKFNDIRIFFQMGMMAPRTYSIQIDTPNGWQAIVKEVENKTRRKMHNIDTVETTRVRLVLEERSKNAETPLTPVCEIRLYNNLNI